MVLSWIKMETISRLTGKLHLASKRGLTPPKLYDSGADFRIEFAENTEGRQVRISCINVTDSLSSVVFMSHPNQLPICHTSRFVESQVWQKCFTESVAQMSLWQECHTSRFVESQGFFHEMQNILLFEYKQDLMQEITYIQEMECVQPLRFRTNHPPPMEKLTPPMEKLRPLGGNREPLDGKAHPPMENDLTPRWKMTRVIRIS